MNRVFDEDRGMSEQPSVVIATALWVAGPYFSADPTLGIEESTCAIRRATYATSPARSGVESACIARGFSTRPS